MLLGDIMADNVNVNINVDDGGGTKKLIKNANELRTSYEGAARAASSIKANAPAPGGTSGSRRAAEMSEQEYGRARGAAGATGASARDFANQAQGLGGLVRLYATYAANVFAVGAAFRALSTALDTTNMIRGMDQLGAATGRNLGTLAERIAQVSDGAISLREAMQTVAQTTAAGMSSKNLERLAVVAKNASQAMGVSMPDALNRLSRGITKLEPELLDELGLFTKIGPATDTYARELGKTAAQLTDFERRQAFANAVLKEGEDKFGAISLQANSYDKLLASLKNLLQTGLEVINKVLGPVIEALANSPTALAAAVGLVGVTIVKQALPAIGQFKQNFARAAEESKNIAVQKAKDAAAAREKLDKLTVDKLDDRLALEVQKVTKVEDKIVEARTRGWAKSSAVAKLAATDIDNITSAQVDKAYNAIAKAETDLNKKISAGKLSPEQVAQEQLRIKLAKEYVGALDNAAASYQKTSDKENKLNESRKNSMRGYSVASLTMRAAAEAERRSTISNIVSNTAYNASLIGVVGALKLTRVALTEANLSLTLFERAALGARVGVAALAGALSTVGAAINKALGIIGIIATVASLLDMGFSKASKEISAAEDAIEGLGKAAEGAGRTLEYLAKNGSAKAITVDGIIAAATAMNELSTSAEAAVKATEKAKQAMGGWDQIKDKFFSLFGSGLDQTLAKNLTGSIQKALELARVSGRSGEAEKAISEALGITSLTKDNIAKAIANLISQGGAGEVAKGIDSLNKKLAEGAGKLGDYKTAIANTKLQFEQFIQSTASTDPLFKLGTALQDFAVKTQTVLTGTAEDINAAFLELQKNPLVASILGADVVKAMVDLRGFDEQVRQVKDYEDAVTKATKEVEDLNEKAQKLFSPANLQKQLEVLEKGGEVQSQTINKLFKARQFASGLLEKPITLDATKLDAARNALVTGLGKAFEAGGAYIEQALGNARERAQLTVEKALSQGLVGVEKVEKETQLRNREIQLRIKAIDVNIQLILGQAKLTAAIEEANAAAELEKKPGDAMAQARFDSAKIVSAILTSGAPNISTGKSVDAAIDNIVSKLGEGISETARNLARNTLLGPASAIAAQGAARTVARGELAASNIQGDFAKRQALVETEIRALDTTNKRIEANKALLATITSITGEQDLGLVLQKQALDADLAANKNKAEILQIDREIADARQSGGKQSIAAKEQQKLDIESRQALENRNRLDQNALEILNTKGAIRARELEVTKAQIALQNASIQVDLEVSQAREVSMANILGMSQVYLAYLSNRQTVEKAITDQQQQAGQIRSEYLQKELATTAQLDALKAKRLVGTDEFGTAIVDPTLEAAIAALEASLGRQATLRDAAIAQTALQVTKAKELADINMKAANEQERYNKLLEDSVIIADSLKVAFGGVGEKLGDLTKALTEVAIEQEKNTKAVSKAKEQYEFQASLGELGINNTKEMEDARSALAKEEDKQRKAEIKGQGQVLSATKKLFSEKTAAYKILSAAEKAHHIFTLALNAKELFMKLTATTAVTGAKVAGEATQTAAEGAGFFARLPVYIASIYAKTFGQLGIFGPPVAAALVAAMLAAVGGGGGGKSIPGISAEQRQETQGSAMGYDAQGNLVQTRRGVFGDTSAKSESVARSLEIIRDNSVKGLTYNNSMLKALEKIRDSLDTTAKQLFRLPGLKAGTISGTTEGTSKSGIKGLFGKETTTEIIDSGIKLAGTFGEIVKAGADVIQSYEVVQKTVKKSGFLGIGGGTSTSSSTITAQLPENARRAIASAFSYGEGLILGIADYLNMNLEAVGAKLSQVSVDELISLRGLTGEDFTKALNNILSAVLDDATYAIFSNLEKFANFGEGMLETVIRVTNTNAQVLQSLKNTTNRDLEEILYLTGVEVPKYVQGVMLGVKTLSTEVTSELTEVMFAGTEAAQGVYRYFTEQSIALGQAREILGNAVVDQIGGDLSQLTQTQLQTLKDAGAFFVEQIVGQVQDGVTVSFASADIRLISIEITEALATAAGGLDKFLEQANYFSENFLTEAERLVPVRKAVTAELERLGLGYVDTIDEFKTAVQSLDLTKVADRQTLIELYAVQEGFIELYGAVSDSSKVESLRIELLKLEGKTTEALNAQRQKEFDTLSEGEQALQAQIWLLEDLAALRKLDVSLLQAQGRNYEALLKNREDELRLLTQEQKLKKLAIYQQEDANKTLTLQIRLLKAFGLAQQATSIERQQELNQYSSTDQALLTLIYSFEDAVSAAEALQKTLQSTTSAIGTQIKQLQDYKKTLLGGDKSTLTTLQKYTNAKAEVERLTGIILNTSTSEKDRADAINSLTGASDQFLSLSRSLYSSSEVYTRDFNSITTLLDSVTGQLGVQLTDAERQLTAIEDSATFLSKIDESTADTTVLLDRYLTNLQTFLTAAAAAPSNIVSQIAPAIASAIASYSSITGTTPATPTGVAPTPAQTVQEYAQIYDPVASGMTQDTASTAAFTPATTSTQQITNDDAANFIKQLYANIGMGETGPFAYAQDGFNYWLNELLASGDKAAIASTFADSVRAYLAQNYGDAHSQHIRDYRAANGLPAFASGVDYLSRNMVAQVHQGERIISAPENAEIARAFTSKDENSRELVQEIKKLNEKVSSLERTVAEGAVLNVQATDRNTQEISRSVSDSTKTVAHTEAIRRRTTVV